MHIMLHRRRKATGFAASSEGLSVCDTKAARLEGDVPSVVDLPLEEALTSPAFFDDPIAVYHRLREQAPVFWSETFQAWMVSRYDDVTAILKDTERFSSTLRLTKWLEQLPRQVQGEIGDLRRHFASGLVQADPPRHGPMRAIMNKAFTPSVVEGLQQRIQQVVDDHLDAVALRGRMDLVMDLAYPLPVTIICEMVGVPTEDIGRYLRWTRQVHDSIGTGAPRVDVIRNAQAGVLELEAYFLDLFAKRRAEPRGDMISTLVALDESAGGMSENDLLANYGVFISAGHESTTSLIVNGTYELLRHPDQVELLKVNSALIKSAIEEMLRWVTPFQRDMRLPIVDVEIRGRPVKAGQLVWCLLAAANRDPEQFQDPDRFDITRQDNRHVAFGLGAHYCLGAPLARQEAGIAIETILRRFEGVRLSDEAVEWPKDYRLRVPKVLTLQFDAVAPRTSPPAP
jgi:pimeloyl-[acyl-carrier protein] synthase